MINGFLYKKSSQNAQKYYKDRHNSKIKILSTTTASLNLILYYS